MASLWLVVARAHFAFCLAGTTSRSLDSYSRAAALVAEALASKCVSRRRGEPFATRRGRDTHARIANPAPPHSAPSDAAARVANATYVTKPKAKPKRMTAKAAALVVAGRGTPVRDCACGAATAAHELCPTQMVERTWHVFGSFACGVCGKAWQQFVGSVTY